ncbi:MAG: ferritin [Oleiphilaceae bacterium]|jgi:ferritin
MLSKKMVSQLNDQINLEFYSSNLYLQMSAWCDFKGFEGAAAFLRVHADEEMQHMQRLFTYVNETGNLACLGTIESPPIEFDSLTNVFVETHKHECTITKAINELAHTAFSEHDYSTFNFLQWYVAEQHEEEKIFKSILDKIEIIGEDDRGLYFIDKELQAMSKGTEPSIVENSGA